MGGKPSLATIAAKNQWTEDERRRMETYMGIPQPLHPSEYPEEPMKTYQYRHEQRVTFEAENDEEALAYVETLDLDSVHDESDDPGEVDLLDEEPMSDGQECPECEAGTIEAVGSELLCRGECGGISENPLWLNDTIQFARLLCEMSSLGIPDTDDDWTHLRENMDLTVEELDGLLGRAQLAWEKAKANV